MRLVFYFVGVDHDQLVNTTRHVSLPSPADVTPNHKFNVSNALNAVIEWRVDVSPAEDPVCRRTLRCVIGVLSDLMFDVSQIIGSIPAVSVLKMHLKMNASMAMKPSPPGSG